MKKISIMSAIVLFTITSGSGQSLNSINGGFAKKEKINGKKFRVIYYEHAIDKTPEEVWAEVSGNYIHVDKVVASITEAHCESGDITEGLGAKRFCAIDFGKRKVEVKEEVIDFNNSSNDRKEFTYQVYESKGFPAKVYNTWIVRKGEDGKTYLGTAFKLRANFALLTGMMARQLKKQGGVKSGVLSYKHYLETGERNVDAKKLMALYLERS